MTNASDPEVPASPARLEAIANPHPELRTTVQLTYPLAGLCPVSGEPQEGSSLSIAYRPALLLLETKSFRRYLALFAGENERQVRDLEQLAQVVALDCAALLGAEVRVIAHYVLQSGVMRVVVRSPAPAAP